MYDPPFCKDSNALATPVHLNPVTLKLFSAMLPGGGFGELASL